MRTLTPDEARAYYDRFGSKQDTQGFYEAAAVQALADHSRLPQARTVFELGCGTGHYAQELLENYLPLEAQYRGVDVSSTMVQLASTRLARFGERARVQQVAGDEPLPLSEDSIDRLISTYVFDLLPAEAALDILRQAYAALQPGGLLCLVSITPGVTPLSRLTMGAWQWVFDRKPAWVGGCRPIRLPALLPHDQWQVQFHTVIVRWGIPSEVVVATPQKDRPG